MSQDTDTYLKPRLCHLLKWPDFAGYGFNLHAEKGKAGQYIGKVDEGSPAAAAGLKDGDRIVEVNGTNIGNENHQQVVSRIKAGGDETKLLVVDDETDQHYRDNKSVVKGDLPEVVYIKAPSHDVEPEQEATEPEAAPEVPPAYNDVQSEEYPPSKPRLCHIKKWYDFNGYGFNLHAERDKPGQFIGKIDENSPAEAADLREGDRIVEVNGTNIEQDTHQKVIELIKGGGNETKMLVVDKACDEYYKSKGIMVTSYMSEVVVTECPTRESPPESEPVEEPAADIAQVELVTEVTEVTEVTQSSEVEAEAEPVAQSTEEYTPEPVEDTVTAETLEQVSAEVTNEVTEATETSTTEISEEIVQTSQELTETSQELTETSPELEESSAEVVESLQNIDSPPVENEAEHTEVAAADVAVANEVEEAAQEITENNVSEVTEHVSSQVEEQAEQTTENVQETVEEASNAVNGQTSYEPPAPAYSPPEPTPAPAPEPVKQANGSADPLANMTAAEMRERLKSKKKSDPRTQKKTFHEKYQMFQKL